MKNENRVSIRYMTNREGEKIYGKEIDFIIVDDILPDRNPTKKYRPPDVPISEELAW